MKNTVKKQIKTNLRTCTRCNIEKPYDQFQRVGIRDYKRRSCKECVAAYHHGLYFGDIKPLDRGANTRKCRRCGEVKMLDNFPLLVGKYSEKGWRKHSCITCDKKDHAAREARRRKRQGEEYRQKNRERNKVYNATKSLKRFEIKKYVMEAYGGTICKCCGEICLTMLTIDHIENDGAAHRKSLTGGRSRSVNIYFYLKQNGFPAGFQVLCYNCNMSKHRNKGICEHQKLD